jgi:peptidyl-prolyl cis-trans isomerase D
MCIFAHYKKRLIKMAVLTEIRNRPWLLMGTIVIALLAFLVNPDSLDKVFGKNPDVLGKVNGEKVTREEYQDQLFVLQQQAQQQGQPTTGLEEQAWQFMVQSKLIKQQFEKLGLKMTDEIFWSMIPSDPMFAQNKSNFDEKGNFKLQEVKKQIEDAKNTNPEAYNGWLKTRKSMEYRMMANLVFNNLSAGITTGKKEAEEMMKQKDNLADIDFVKVNYEEYLKKNPIKVSTDDLKAYIDQHPLRFKSEPSRNLGVVLFPSQASQADEASVLKEMNNFLSGGTENSGGKENFQNTTNDSLFVEANSDIRFNPTYMNANMLPAEIKGKVPASSVGQIFGPYKESGYYVLSKLVGKKASDSTLSSHILVSYKGADRSTATRTKEEAKVMADKILAEVKANPAKFEEDMKESDEPNAVERKGSVGWTTPESPFAPGYLHFLAQNPKGTYGLAETSFGYHIIHVEDKKSGSMGYKVANVAKLIKPSEQTENDVDKKARRFVQQIQGKAFNDFENLAKKDNFLFSNPKNIKRFDGKIQGLGTDKDADIATWAFDKKRKEGDTEFFTVDGTGDRIVVILKGIQDKGAVNPENVRDQLEPIVKNQLASKKIAEKINAAKPSSLEQVAKLFGAAVENAQVNLVSPQVGGAMEPKVAGAAFGVTKGKLSNPIEGTTGTFVVLKKSETVNKQPGDLKQMVQSITQQNTQFFGQGFMKSLQDNADIEDYRIEIFGKMAQ